MTVETDPNFEETVSWHVSVAIAGYLVLQQIAMWVLHRLKDRFSKSIDTLGLLNALLCLKEELLNVGFISIALVSTQQWLSNICVSQSSSVSGVYCPNGETTTKGWRLLSSSGRLTCTATGEEPFISETALHQTHIMIFCIAMCHVFLTSNIMILSQWVVKSWRWWEGLARTAALASDEPSKPMAAAAARAKTVFQKFARGVMTCVWSDTASVSTSEPPRRRVGPVPDFLYSCVAQFARPVTPSVFMSLRRLFLARHDLPPTFDFGLFSLRCIQRVRATQGGGVCHR